MAFHDAANDESASLLGDAARGNHGHSLAEPPVRRARPLFISHLLSTWNSRVFEFGAVLYLAVIFPDTLLPMSVYALTRGLAVILFSSAVGHYVDVGNRLRVVRVSIVYQRLAVAVSCALFYLLSRGQPLRPGTRTGVLGLITALACVEKLCSVMNMVAVERDWVVVLAGKDFEALQSLNAQMRRIDLLCKLLGPLFIATMHAFSIEFAILVNFFMNAASVPVEYFAIARLYRDVPELQETKLGAGDGREHSNSRLLPTRQTGSGPDRVWRYACALTALTISDFSFYMAHLAFLPSFACAMLYLTVLSFSGQMITYLLSAGYSSMHISVARSLSVIIEVLATWVAPWLMSLIGPVRAGLWLSSWQLVMLSGGIAVFFFYENNPLVSASGLVVGTILSRLGLRGFDLCMQLIIQEVRAVVQSASVSGMAP
ncbi:hypothetical protein DCS_05107 [Drechmeria coniospora]|uniref:Solute carrier family 40 member n=1 Tax=Drechmeria coniospora TaxID=98403 RepID=A0A151GLV4_DRECN|nr:hypothetical protein DCS_05107 [Drechmeria coniospora]KYK58094.1 hypothetical protein DCS_05107 [Drechmeria coniospora]